MSADKCHMPTPDGGVCGGELPDLPARRLLCTVMPDEYRYGHVYGYTADQMRAYAAQALRAQHEELERLRKCCADLNDVNALLNRESMQARSCAVKAEARAAEMEARIGELEALLRDVQHEYSEVNGGKAWFDRRNAVLSGATPMQDRIAELEADNARLRAEAEWARPVVEAAVELHLAPVATPRFDSAWDEFDHAVATYQAAAQQGEEHEDAR